jgi:hypothetical protein
VGIFKRRSLSRKAMPTLDENAKRRNNALHHVSRLCLSRLAVDKKWATKGEYMKTLFEKEVLA